MSELKKNYEHLGISCDRAMLKDVNCKLLAELCWTEELCGEINKAMTVGPSKRKQSEVIKTKPFKWIQKQTMSPGTPKGKGSWGTEKRICRLLWYYWNFSWWVEWRSVVKPYSWLIKSISLHLPIFSWYIWLAWPAHSYRLSQKRWWCSKWKEGSNIFMKQYTGCTRNDGFTMHNPRKIVLNISTVYPYMPLNSVSTKCAYWN